MLRARLLFASVTSGNGLFKRMREGQKASRVGEEEVTVSYVADAEVGAARGSEEGAGSRPLDGPRRRTC